MTVSFSIRKQSPILSWEKDNISIMITYVILIHTSGAFITETSQQNML